MSPKECVSLLVELAVVLMTASKMRIYIIS